MVKWNLKTNEVIDFSSLPKIPKDWEWVTVNDIQDSSAMGPFGSRIKSSNYVNFGIPMLRGKNIIDGFINEENLVFLTEKKADELKNSNVYEWDVLFTAYGNIGDVGIILPQSCHSRYVLSQNLMKLTCNHEKINPLFVYYYFKTTFGNYLLLRNAHASGVPAIGQAMTTLRNTPIVLPPKNQQNKIAQIIFLLDLQILSLKNQNKVLEQIAQTIFKSWFVDFDGVTEFEDSELGKIPKGWNITELKDVLSLLKDGSHNPPKRAKSGIRFIAGATDVKHFAIDFSKCSHITQEDYEEIHKNWQINTNDVLLTIVGTIGNVAIVKQTDLPFSLQRSLAVLRPNEKINFVFLYMLLNSLEFKQFLYANLSPTGQPGIYLGTLGGFKFILPPKSLIDQFYNVSQDIVTIIQKNYSVIDNLTYMRDSLLPKLMSGEIRI